MSGDLDTLATAFMTSQMLHVVEELGIADLLKNGPAGASQLARATGCDPTSLARLLRALTLFDVLAEDGTGRFRLTRAGERLRRDHPASLAPMVHDSGAPHVQAAWLELGHAVRTGHSAFQYAHGTEYWTYLARRPELAAQRSEALAKRLSEQVREVVEVYDFSSVETMVDVGGGCGTLLAAILERNPEVTGILFDQPSMGPVATAFLTERGLAERVRIVAGDFFNQIPSGADAYLLSNVIGDWGDQESLRILRTCRRAAQRTSRLVVVETLATRAMALADLEKMVLFGEARERTEDELRHLVEAAGFGVARIVRTASEDAVLEAFPESGRLSHDGTMGKR